MTEEKELQPWQRPGPYAVVVWKVRRGGLTEDRHVDTTERRTKDWCDEQADMLNKMHASRQHFLEFRTVERMPDWLIEVLDEETAEQASLYEQLAASQRRVRTARENWSDKLPEPELPGAP